MTRRGFGASSQPSEGYDLGTLTLDIKRVLDGISIGRVGEIRATRIFGRDGHFIRSVTPDRIAHAVAVMVEHPNYAAVHARTLSIYAVYENLRT
jgi:hypothetical protein